MGLGGRSSAARGAVAKDRPRREPQTIAADDDPPRRGTPVKVGDLARPGSSPARGSSRRPATRRPRATAAADEACAARRRLIARRLLEPAVPSARAARPPDRRSRRVRGGRRREPVGRHEPRDDRGRPRARTRKTASGPRRARSRSTARTSLPPASVRTRNSATTAAPVAVRTGVSPRRVEQMVLAVVAGQARLEERPQASDRRTSSPGQHDAGDERRRDRDAEDRRLDRQPEPQRPLEPAHVPVGLRGRR